MYAIIRTGGKQSKVHEGDVIDVERLKNAGDTVEFTPLLVVDAEGNAVSDRNKLNKLKVQAKVLGEVQGSKVDIFKYKNKSGNRRRQGHRQKYTTLEVTSIGVPAKKKTKADPEKVSTKKTAEATESEEG
jgi:large subunit ribosomal protein L21